MNMEEQVDLVEQRKWTLVPWIGLAVFAAVSSMAGVLIYGSPESYQRWFAGKGLVDTNNNLDHAGAFIEFAFGTNYPAVPCQIASGNSRMHLNR